MKGIILCGGLATRFLPITKSIPKEMLPILNRPAIDYIVKDFQNNGITDILIILGRNKECLENYYDRNIELEDRLSSTGKFDLLEELKNIYSGINISFVRQINAKGTGYAVKMAKNFVGNEPFILSFPDEIIIGQSFAKQLIEEFERTNANILPLRQIEIKDCQKYGMIDYENKEGNLVITNIVEKPSIENSPSDICYIGGGIFKSEIFQAIDKCLTHSNGEIYLTDAFFSLMKENDLLGKIIIGDRIDFGNPLGFVKGNIIASLNDERYSDEIISFMKNILSEF